jgi:DNA uptake protein ComE-like DNA-binding protein
MTSQTGATAAAATAKLNLNTVTEDQLMSTIPNFSTRMGREFMEYRPYISIQQFRKEIGKYVSADQVATYEQYVYVPIAVDQADAATLQQLPGVDATIADQLIAGRPYGSSQAFLTKLAGLVSAADGQRAAAYIAAA